MWTASFADFSSAAPWAGGGLAAGILVYAAARALMGIDRHRMADLAAARARLDEAQSAASITALTRNRLEAELAQTAPRAAMADRLEEEVAQLRSTVGQHQASLNDASRQFVSLREEIETHHSNAQFYEDEFSRLSDKHDKLGNATYAQLSEMTKQISELNDRISAEAVAHGDEVAALKAQIAAMPREGIDPEMYESEVAALLDAVKDLRMEASASEGAVKESRAVLDQCGILKDALQAVNRIAAALPDSEARH